MKRYSGIKECLGFFSKNPNGTLTCIEDNRHNGGMEGEEVWIKFNGDEIMLQTQFENNMNLSIFGDKLTYIDEYDTANEEPVDIIPEIKAGTEPQRVLAEDGTENQENEILTECVVREELERRNMMLDNVKRLEKTVDRLLDIVEGMVQRGEF